MIKQLVASDYEEIYSIINDGAMAYAGIIPPDRWKEPYMSREELRHEIEEGVEFWGYVEAGRIIGVMGIQDVQDVALIRHAYVRTSEREKGVGSKLLAHLLQSTGRPVLIGTWSAAAWAVNFYEKFGFRQVSPAEKERLLQKYWSIPDRQIQTSVVLADQKWYHCSKNR